MQVKKQQLELDMEQWTGFKSGKEYVKAAYCHPACLSYMQSTSCEMPGWSQGNRVGEGWFLLLFLYSFFAGRRYYFWLWAYRV